MERAISKYIRVIRLIIIAGIAALSVFADTACNNRAEYEIYAVSYGHSQYREDVLYENGDPAKNDEIEWMFWIIKGNGLIVMVDTGFDDEAAAQKMKFSYYVQPVERLKQMNLHPSDITDVIITHTHWDHIGGLEHYSDAVLWLQEKEYDYVKQRAGTGNLIQKKALEAFKRSEDHGRLRLVKGSRQIIPGIKVFLDGAHTPGHQHLAVTTPHGLYVIAGDAAYTHHNIDGGLPVGLAVDREAAREVLAGMKKRAGSPERILPGHCPTVIKRFPAVSDGIVHVIIEEK